MSMVDKFLGGSIASIGAQGKVITDEAVEKLGEQGKGLINQIADILMVKEAIIEATIVDNKLKFRIWVEDKKAGGS